MNFAMAAQSSLYNEDRNLLRMRERERRNQEALQGRDKFPQKTPLFAEPYKTNKGDELSSRIQNMLGDYEEVKEFISNRSHQDFIGIPKVVAPLLPLGKPARPSLPEKSSQPLAPPCQPATHCPPALAAPHRALPRQKAPPRAEPTLALHPKGLCLPSSQGTGRERSRGGQESRAGWQPKRSERRAPGEAPAEQLQASLLALSPLLSALSSPVAPLSPLHSSQHASAGSQSGSKGRGLTSRQPEASQDLGAGSEEKESWEGPALPLASTAQPPSQAFPQPLPSKPSAMQQKPTAYVRPMDGQDQAPVESPELKPLLEEYHGEPYGKILDLKANAKAKLSKLEIPSEPLEQTFPGDVHSIEDILKEMTHSWPPPLTAIHTPSTAEPSKFPFPAKEPQHTGAAAQSQRQYEAPSKPLPAPQPPPSMLQEDLHLSDSEESGDDQVVEQPPPELAPPGYSALQSQPRSVASAHSSSLESGGSTSGSDSSSDSETDSSASDANTLPPVPAPQPEPPACNKWQLDNWLSKVNPAAVPTDSVSQSSPGHGPEEDKEQQQGSSSSSQQPPEPREPDLQGCSPAAPQDAQLPPEPSCQQAPGHTQEPLPRHTVGIKRPSKAPVHEEPKGGLKVESEPGLCELREQPCRDKPKVKTKGKAKSRDRKEPKPALPEPPEKRKHKNSQQASAKPFLDPKPTRELWFGSAQEHLILSPLPEGQGTTPPRTSGHRPPTVAREDCHKEKLPLPGQESKLGSPVRDPCNPQSLVVKIHLPLLSRVPQSSGTSSQQKRAEAKEHPGARKRKATDPPDKPLPKRKRKMEEEVERKKPKSEQKSIPLLPAAEKDSSKLKTPKAPCETQNQDLLLPTALPPKSAAAKPSKVAPKRPISESRELPDTDNTARSKSSHKDPLSSKHRKVESDQPGLSKGIKGSAGDVSKPFPVPSLPNGTSKPRRPQLKAEKKHPVEHYREEAKRLKHQADSMTDKTGKALQYLDAALAFIEYGIALELDAPAPKSASSIFRDTIDLIQFITRVMSFTGSSASCHEEIFLVLCTRCQALLHMAMFQYKRETAVKYCRLLSDLFKISSRAAPAASPCVARSTGLPSPLSPLPSPAGSGSSQPGSNASSSSGSSSSVTVPSNVPSITSSYISITSYILQAWELWEQADGLAKKNKASAEFFAELSTATGPLALTSSLRELLHYTRQGLQWLRMETNSP
ncbi:AF4/FMR2 family member 1 [Indicator indicator]|uniref:AF4/FMR2 family member 1 n=1 Tax=Indicator indicator TaxID=1002788 RepID=UPI0023DF699E|nr:AF4/FMR2 family member 1 [Indicator indicator]